MFVLTLVHRHVWHDRAPQSAHCLETTHTMVFLAFLFLSRSLGPLFVCSELACPVCGLRLLIDPHTMPLVALLALILAGTINTHFDYGYSKTNVDGIRQRNCVIQLQLWFALAKSVALTQELKHLERGFTGLVQRFLRRPRSFEQQFKESADRANKCWSTVKKLHFDSTRPRTLGSNCSPKLRETEQNPQ